MNKAEGEFYETEIIKIDDEDRECGMDCIAVTLEKNKDYIKSEVDIANINYGKLLDIDDLVNYHADNNIELEKSYHESVNERISMCVPLNIW